MTDLIIGRTVGEVIMTPQICGTVVCTMMSSLPTFTNCATSYLKRSKRISLYAQERRGGLGACSALVVLWAISRSITSICCYKRRFGKMRSVATTCAQAPTVGKSIQVDCRGHLLWYRPRDDKGSRLFPLIERNRQVWRHCRPISPL